ncbi:MAG: hypothetical protein ACO1PW_09300 [Actinomycetota bacterium]
MTEPARAALRWAPDVEAAVTDGALDGGPQGDGLAHPGAIARPAPASSGPGAGASAARPDIDTVLRQPAHTARVDDVARALGVLRRRAGDRGLELPEDLGRALADLEMLLTEGPTGIDTGRALPALAAELATMVSAAARATVELVPGEAEVLGEALAADLCDLRLDHLLRIADAVLAVSRAPRAAELWGDPRAAEAAEAVITASASDLREAAVTHEWLYEHFTDRVWTVPTPLLERGQRRWRVAARARLSTQLRRASRSGRIPSRLGDAAAGVLLARRARARVDAVAPLLSQHLGVLHRGPLSDADAALRALQAVRELHAALGELVDAQRLRRLLLADAFRSEDVFGPAVNVRMALGAWRRDVEGAGGQDALTSTLLELADWSEWVLELLPTLRDATEAAAEVGAAVTSVRDLAQLYLLRQHVAELTAAQAAARAAQQAAADAALAAEQDAADRVALAERAAAALAGTGEGAGPSDRDAVEGDPRSDAPDRRLDHATASGGTRTAVETAEALLAALRGEDTP